MQSASENRSDQVVRLANGRWAPGVSGNFGGRPKALRDVVAAARQHTVEAVDTLATIMRDTKAPPAARVAAANALLDRGWGKPMQPVEGDSGMQRPVANYSIVGLDDLPE